MKNSLNECLLSSWRDKISAVKPNIIGSVLGDFLTNEKIYSKDNVSFYRPKCCQYYTGKYTKAADGKEYIQDMFKCVNGTYNFSAVRKTSEYTYINGAWSINSNEKSNLLQY